MATQADIIRSERVARQVVHALALNARADLREDWLEDNGGRGDFDHWLAQGLLKMLELRPARDSNVLTLAVRGRDPELAAAIANAFAQAAIQVQRELRMDPAQQNRAFFETQAAQARERLTQAQTRLATYQRQRGTVAGDDRLEVETARMADLSARLTALQAELGASEGRRSQSRGPQAGQLQDVLNHPLLATVRTDLARAEAAQRELQTRLGERHPQVLQARAQVDALRQRLEQETQRVAGGVDLSHTLGQQQLQRLQSTLEAQRGHVQALKTTRDGAAALLREAEHAQRAYDEALVRLNQAGLASRSQHASADVLAPAALPTRPIWPKPVMHAGMAGGLGLVLALMAVVLMEKVDPRARTARSTSELIGLPLLGVMPGAATRGEHRVRRMPLVRQGWRLRLAAAATTPRRVGGGLPT
jgi:chain length determinant protein EpsF